VTARQSDGASRHPGGTRNSAVDPHDARHGVPLLARVLAAYLVAGEPLTFALVASGALNRLVLYGFPAFLLLSFRGAVIGLGIAAGRALWRDGPHGAQLGQWWAALHACAVAITFATPYFPSNRTPSARRWTLAALLLFDAACWTWLTLRRRRPGAP
jgi:hypothetical protein